MPGEGWRAAAAACSGRERDRQHESSPAIAPVPQPTLCSFHTCRCPLPTPQARFTEAILRQMAGIHFPMDRIFSQTVSGQPKSEVWDSGALCVFCMLVHAPRTCHWLQSCCRIPAVEGRSASNR